MKLIPTISLGKNTKTCGTCTKCCEGWVGATIEGRQVFAGQPCYFLSRDKEKPGCSRYDTRPINPCRKFSCTWLDIKDIPDEWKPEKCGVIMRSSKVHQIDFIHLVQAPNTPSKEMIEWAKIFFKKKAINFVYADKRGVHPFGEKEFIRAVREHKEEFYEREFDEYIKNKFNIKN